MNCPDCNHCQKHVGHGECWYYCDAYKKDLYADIIWGCGAKYEKRPDWCPIYETIEIEIVKKPAFDFKKFTQNSINSLTEKNDVRDWTEAIAICVRNLRDRNDRLVRVQFNDNFEQEMEFYMQIAEMLLNKKRS